MFNEGENVIQRKLYEYSILVRYGVVVAATNEATADQCVKELSADGVKINGDIMDVADIDLVDVRKLKTKKPELEAHFVVD